MPDPSSTSSLGHPFEKIPAAYKHYSRVTVLFNAHNRAIVGGHAMYNKGKLLDSS